MSEHEKLIEIRCVNANCNKLLLKADIKEGKVQIRCKCGTTTVIQISKPDRQLIKG